MTPPKAVRHLTVDDLAARYQTTRWGIYKRLQRSQLPAPIRLGGPRSALLWAERDVEAWERDHRLTA